MCGVISSVHLRTVQCDIPVTSWGEAAVLRIVSPEEWRISEATSFAVFDKKRVDLRAIDVASPPLKSVPARTCTLRSPFVFLLASQAVSLLCWLLHIDCPTCISQLGDALLPLDRLVSSQSSRISFPWIGVRVSTNSTRKLAATSSWSRHKIALG